MAGRYDFARYLNVRSAYGPTFVAGSGRIAFLTNITGVPQVWAVDAAAAWPDQLTFSAERVTFVRAAPRGPWLAFGMDTGGNEHEQLFLLSPGGDELRPLTDQPDAIHTFGGWSPDGRRLAFASNRRNRAFFDVYVQDIAGDEAHLVLQHDGNNYPVAWSPDSDSLIVARYHTNLNNDLYRLDLRTGEAAHLTPHDGEALYESVSWSPDGASLFLVADAVEQRREFAALVQLQLATGTMSAVREPPWDVQEVRVSADGRYAAYTVNEDGASRLAVVDLATDQESPVPDLPLGVVDGLTWSPDRPLLAFALTGPGHNYDVWTWEPGSEPVRFTRSSTAGIPRETFIAPERIHYPTFDGRQVPAFYYHPRPGGERVPVVVYVHGGPEAQERAIFNPTFQYLLHRGYAVFAPNVRGSTGYGRAYTHLDDVRLRMDAVRDLASGVAWLRAEGSADPARIAILGGSYGGFMVLAALTTYPELWAAGVDIVGIANFRTFLENTGPWRRKLREAEYGSLERDADFLDEISPIHHVDRIRAPLLVIHGANDPRVPVGEAEQIVTQVRARGGVVEYRRFEDEGHGIVKLPNRIRAYTAIADFLDRHVLDRPGRGVPHSADLAGASE